VKPIHLNLASRPFRDYRPVYAVVVIMALVTAFLALNNVDTFLRYRTETKTTRADIDKLGEQIAGEQRQTETLTQRLKGVDIKLLASQTEFANAQLAERAFSWSELLDRLERVLPTDVRLVSVSPSFSKDGLVHLSMTCITKTGEGLTATINRFNGDSHFANTFPTIETVNGGVGEPREYHITLGVDYRPSIARRVE
jgi:Tfp pilus assembly protein PilN